MPQLDPAPWLMVFTYTWFVLLVIAPPKVLAHTFPLEPTAQTAKPLKTEPWNWLYQ